jgi:putative transposase
LKRGWVRTIPKEQHGVKVKSKRILDGFASHATQLVLRNPALLLHVARYGRYPAELYTPSARIYRTPDPPEYPFHDRAVLVTQCGRICIGNRKINLSTVFAGQFVGIREVADKIWLVSFLDFDLGFFDEVAARVEPGANPFASKVLTMCPV